MIYTVTLNPSVDYIVQVEDLTLGETNRTCKESIRLGGKGLNISIVLKRLGIESVAIGFIGGFTGDAIAEMAAQSGIKAEFIRCGGNSRINVKLKAREETEINGKGASIGEVGLKRLMRKLERLKDGDWLVLAGSVPHGDENVYAEIMRSLSGKDVKVVVDASGEPLKRTLCLKPFLVKPNLRELEEIFGVQIDSEEQVVRYAKETAALGAKNVVVSMAEKGALMLAENGQICRCVPPRGRLIDSVGAGDSLIAGFIAGFLGTGSFEEAFRTGVAAGSATAFSEWLADGDLIASLKKQMDGET